MINIKLLEEMGVSKLVGWCKYCEAYEIWQPGILIPRSKGVMQCQGDHEDELGKRVTRYLVKRRAFICLQCWDNPAFFSLKDLEQHIELSHDDEYY